MGESIDISKFSHQLKLGDRLIYIRVHDIFFYFCIQLNFSTLNRF